MLARIARNTTYLTLSGGAAAALAVVNMPQIVAAIGLEAFGRIVVMQSIAATVAAFLMPQTWQSLMKYAHRAADGTVRNLSSSLFGLGYAFEIVGGTVALAVSAAIMLLVLGPEYQQQVPGLLLVATAALFTQAKVSDAVLRERGMFHAIATAQVGCQAFKVLAMLMLIGRANFFYVCLIIFLAEGGRLAAMAYLSRRGLAPIVFSRLLSPGQIPSAFYSSVFWINASDIVDLPVRHVDKILISGLLGPAAAGIFAIFKKLSGVFGIVADALYQSTYPVLAQLVAVDHVRAVGLARKIGGLFFVAGIMPLVLLLNFSSLWLPFVIPTLQIDVRLEVAVLLSATFLAMCFIMIHPLYILCGHEKHNASVTLVVNAIYLGALWLLSLSLGLLGAVVACGLQYFLIIGIKLVHLNLWTFPRLQQAAPGH